MTSMTERRRAALCVIGPALGLALSACHNDAPTCSPDGDVDF